MAEVQASGLQENTMNADFTPEAVTILAPNNGAFAAIDEATLLELLGAPEDLAGVRCMHAPQLLPCAQL